MSSNFSDKIEMQAEKSFWDAHIVLDKYSETGDPNIAGSIQSLTVEQAALRVISLSARDTYRLSPRKLSSFEKQKALSDQEILIAGIGMGRHDIGMHDGHPKLTNADKTKTIRFVTEKNFAFTEVNPDGDPEYNRANWEKDRMRHLEHCLNEGANIICLGEFDFPPEQDGADDSIFEQAILNRINNESFPVFVLAGSRHEYDREEGTCRNVARIIVNDSLYDAPDGRVKERIFHYNKTIPAVKVGERLTPPDGIEARYFDTKLGRIAVLICVDAYNPTLMLSLIDPKLYQRNKANPDNSDRLDFILVPSYNFSPKLYYSCQVLSLLCRCTVLLVDACSHWMENKDLKCHEVELFFNGRSFSDRARENDEIGTKEVNDRNVHLWRLKRNFLRAAETENRGNNPTPSFEALRAFWSSVSNKD